MSKHTKETLSPAVRSAATKVKATASMRSRLSAALHDKLEIPKFLAANIAKQLPGYLGKTLFDALEAVMMQERRT